MLFPQRLNAWTDEMEHAYFGLLEDCAASEQVRAIVVTGAGRGFCAGADMRHLQELSDGNVEHGRRARERRPQTFPHSVPKPIIAAINGACAGIGFVACAPPGGFARRALGIVDLHIPVCDSRAGALGRLREMTSGHA